MDLKQINESTARFPFKPVKGKRGLKFRQEIKSLDGTGSALEIEHNGHDHLTFDFRNLYKRENGRLGDKRYLTWTMDTKATVQLASLLLYLVEEHMRDSDECPYLSIVTNKEKAGFGSNWINEDFDTALMRTELRKSRSHLFGLMKRCIETCQDNEFIEFLAINFGLWAEQSGDEFAMQQAEKAIAQLGLLPSELIN